MMRGYSGTIELGGKLAQVTAWQQKIPFAVVDYNPETSDQTQAARRFLRILEMLRMWSF
jgi:hypothetical protein